jgi:hypothetical protein
MSRQTPSNALRAKGVEEEEEEEEFTCCFVYRTDTE